MQLQNAFILYDQIRKRKNKNSADASISHEHDINNADDQQKMRHTSCFSWQHFLCKICFFLLMVLCVRVEWFCWRRYLGTSHSALLFTLSKLIFQWLISCCFSVDPTRDDIYEKHHVTSSDHRWSAEQHFKFILRLFLLILRSIGARINFN